nr:PREDICTED: coactosin-like protein [Opisthocomus hoazin]
MYKDWFLKFRSSGATTSGDIHPQHLVTSIPNIWVTFKYNGSTIVPGDQGVDYETFKRKCTDDVRLFGFVRFTTGDAMSKRVKFALITWIGEDVSGLQRAKTGTDKTLVKEVVQNFAKEFVISDHKELDEDYIKNELKKAGGANYDAQTE